MQFLIVVKIREAVLRLVPLFDPALELTQLFEVRRRHPKRSHLGRKALDASQSLEKVDDLANGQLRDMGATPWHELDQALGRQHLQRLAQWGPRDLQLLAEFGLVDPLARRQLTLHDHVANSFRRLVMQGTAADRRCSADFLTELVFGLRQAGRGSDSHQNSPIPRRPIQRRESSGEIAT